MRRFVLGFGWLAILLAMVDGVSAQETAAWPVTEAGWEYTRGSGWYFSLFKMIAALAVFFAWLPVADWISQDAQRLKLGWKKWNAIVVFSFLACFLLHYLIPWGYLGLLVAILGYAVPVTMYVKTRNRATTADDYVCTRDHFRRWLAERLQTVGIKIKLEPRSNDVPLELLALGGSNAGEEKAVSIRLPTMNGATNLRKLFLDALEKRAGAIVLDYSQQGVAVKYQIDGVLHDAPRRDRATGDPMLEVLKTAAFLNPAERVNRQSGELEIKLDKTRRPVKITAQGTPTGERVVLQIDDGAPHQGRLDTIGMRPKMQEELKEILARPQGFVLVAAAPGKGRTTLFTAVTAGVDRFMRSAAGIESAKTDEIRVENVVPNRFDPDKGETPATILPTVARKYPDVYVVADLVDGKSVELLCDEVTDEKRLVVAGIGAKDAAEALLRVLMLKAPIKKFASTVSAVVCGRLARRLCDECKQAYAPPPQLLQQLRIPAGKVAQLYRQYQPPPLEGNKKPPPPCSKCNGLGYHGRTGFYELLVVNDDVRAALMKQPSLESLRPAAQKAGMHTLQEEAIGLVVQGITSVEEIMRVMKEQSSQ